MIAVGEQIGRARAHARPAWPRPTTTEVEVATERMTAVIEPIMILLMAVIVAFIVMSIILPMLQLGSSVH